MIFHRVSPVKGKRVLYVAMALLALVGLALGMSPSVIPSEAAAPADRNAPAAIYGVGEALAYSQSPGGEPGLRRREVVLDATVLAGSTLELPGDVLAFGLFEDLALFGVVEAVTAPMDGLQVYSGRILDKDHGYFAISLDAAGRALAQIEVLEDNVAFIIAEAVDTGKYIVTEMPLNEVRTAASIAPQVTPEGAAAGAAPADAKLGPASISLLVAYTPAAEDWADEHRSGIMNVIAQSLERANQTFADSGVELSLRLALAAPVDYLESGDALTDLNRATFSRDFDPDGWDPGHMLDELHDWRADYGADLVVLMTAGDAGASWLLKNPEGDARYGFSVAPVQTADVSLVRQIGYNLGCHHSRTQLESAAPKAGGLYTFSTGARWAGADGRNYASIMTWPENDIQVFLFSNPEIAFAGAPAGVRESADNARSLRAVMHRVAGYHDQIAPDDDAVAASTGGNVSGCARCKTEISDVPWDPASILGDDKVIYGTDDRIDVYQETNATRLSWAASTCALVDASRLIDNGNGTYSLQTSAYRINGLEPCPGERFANQPVAAFCTGFKVRDDIIATAGHCIQQADLPAVRFVFGFDMTDATTPVLTFNANQIYTGTAIISRQNTNMDDYAVVRVDRPISIADALPLRREGEVPVGAQVGVIGHPSGLPKKLAFSNETLVRANNAEGYFTANLDTYGGNSGSPVFNVNTNLVEGILVGGQPDFVMVGNCFRSNELPNETVNSEFVSKSIRFANAVFDDAEGEGEADVPTADFSAESLVRDRHALLPLHDWVPLFRFTMSYDPENFAPRHLRRMVFRLLNDDRDDAVYRVVRDLHVTDLLELGIFVDQCTDTDEADEPRYGTLDSQDQLRFSWDSNGYDRGNLITATPVQGTNLLYDITFNTADPYYRLTAGPTTDDCDGNVFILAVRTSATWRSALTLGAELIYAEMVDAFTGGVPRDEEGLPLDGYSPNFFDNETLEAEAFYSASFGVYDPSGVETTLDIFEEDALPTANVWYHTPYFHIPLAEFTRPRWNKPQQMMSIVAGEFIGIRQLIPLDGWTSVIGINLHSGRSYSSNPYDDGSPFAELREVNIILTDVGGDPFGPPGNGGFNPRDALKPMRNEWSGTREEDLVNAGAYNGIWVWKDTNANALFNAPTPQPNGGVTLNGDEPLAPVMLNYDWEYIPEPPGGGDPWWKIRLLFGANSDFPQAYTSPVPNNVWDEFKRYSEVSYDFHVVARLDSGHKDVSLSPASNTGATMGAEFRAFIEPRRMDVMTSTWTGGIYVTSQIPDLFLPNFDTWQNDPRWFDEPFWPERTLNPAAAKPFKVGVDVHDLVTTYRSQAETYRTFLNNPEYWLFNLTPAFTTVTLGHVPVNNTFMTWLGAWVDPLGLGMFQFQNGHYPEIYGLLLGRTTVTTTILADLFGETFRLRTPPWGFDQFAFEVRPFYEDFLDAPPVGPRSPAYPLPPLPPVLPTILTWPATLEPGNYPRLSDWNPQDAQARLLTQKIEARSKHTAMLGINLAGSIDPIVNDEGNSLSLAEINVAFWGPDFSPDILMPLDPDRNQNQTLASGVLLWEKSPEGDISSVLPFTFLNSEELDRYDNGDIPLPLIHDIVPLTGLRWSGGPEFVDLSGDGNSDDLNGDGVVDDLDKAWVLTLQPSTQWTLPFGDAVGSPEGGIDLYITVKTSDAISRFQKFRAVVPATLPSRPVGRRRAGIQFYPAVNTSPFAYIKQQGDEGPVQEYYGHDMIEANVPMRIVDMTQRWTDLHIGGAAVPVLGLDISTNREDGTRIRGASGAGFARGFQVAGARWQPNVFAGDFLIDNRYESYEILGNTADTLTLLSGTPRNGPWRIVQDPTFLEEVTVELYQEGAVANFNPLTDLLPLDIDQRISGVAIYRDNDNHPDNRNGMFDPDIDIPLMLDAPPRFVGRSAEDVKVRFVFSTPGTRDFPLPIAEQPRNRQWVHDSFGFRVGDPEEGPDFFIVLRASQNMQLGDNLRAGIVSWGPNTPTEPDPHIWANLPGEERHDYLKFREFPWGERGAGFVTFFKEPPVNYFLNGAQGVQRPDSSGYNWIRSHSAQKRRSGVITARNRPEGPLAIRITSVSQSRLPIQTLPGLGFSFVIYGRNFGTSPMVALSGYNTTVTSATDTAIGVTIETRGDVVPEEPITLVVRNPLTGDEVSRSDLFTLTNNVSVNGPKIDRVIPGKGRKDDFPVVVRGWNFFDPNRLEVRFGGTRMPILDVAPDGTGITVGFPIGGFPQPGMLDVFVSSTGANSGQDVKVNGFEYVNPESRDKVRFFGCGPAERTGMGAGGDLLLVAGLIALLAFTGRRGAVQR